MPDAPPARSNVRPGNLLRALSKADRALLLPHLQQVSLNSNDLLEAAGERVAYAYFPRNGLIAVIAEVDSKLIQVGFIGCEGMTGASIILKNDQALNDARVQLRGTALRIPAATFATVVSESSSMQELFLRYIGVSVTQAVQTALAASHLNICARVARWLLMVHDRIGSSAFGVTHEMLAAMLGVRRAGVTVAIHLLEGRHLIRSTRARIEILDRLGLEDLVGAGYGESERHYRRLFPESGF